MRQSSPPRMRCSLLPLASPRSRLPSPGAPRARVALAPVLPALVAGARRTTGVRQYSSRAPTIQLSRSNCNSFQRFSQVSLETCELKLPSLAAGRPVQASATAGVTLDAHRCARLHKLCSIIRERAHTHADDWQNCAANGRDRQTGGHATLPLSSKLRPPAALRQHLQCAAQPLHLRLQ